MEADLLALMTRNFSQVANATPRDPCGYRKHEWLEAKLILISVCGTTLAILGILGNVITAVVLTRPGMRSPNNLYLTFLAIFDTLLLLAAILLYSIEYIFEYLDSLTLYNAWLKFVRCGFVMSHVAQTGSVYITVAVTFERYLAVLHPKRAKIICTHDRATLTVAIVIGFAILFNSTKYFEIEVIQRQNCTGFGAQRLTASALLNNHLYQTVHSLWLTQMVMVFIPFLVLLFANTAIVCKVRQSLRRLSWIQRGRKRNQLKEKSRDATKVLLVIVLVFLVCNSWGFVTTLLENMYTEEKLREWWPEFYAFSREAINFLAIVNSSINFVIYCIFGKDFRQELVSIWVCKGRMVMLPTTDKFTAERLLASTSSHRRRPSAFVRYLNLIRVAQNILKDQAEQTKKSEVSSLDKASPPATKDLPRQGTSLVSHRSFCIRRGEPKRATEKASKTLHRASTISSGDYNGDFVSVGREESPLWPCHDGRRGSHQSNGNVISVSADSLSPKSCLKKLMSADAWLHSINTVSAAPDGLQLDCASSNLDVEALESIPIVTAFETAAPEISIAECEEDIWV